MLSLLTIWRGNVLRTIGISTVLFRLRYGIQGIFPCSCIVMFLVIKYFILFLQTSVDTCSACHTELSLESSSPWVVLFCHILKSSISTPRKAGCKTFSYICCCVNCLVGLLSCNLVCPTADSEGQICLIIQWCIPWPHSGIYNKTMFSVC